MFTTIDLIETSPSEDTPVSLHPLRDKDGALHVAVTLSAVPERCDYGVSGSPVWYEPKDVQVEGFEINGEGFDPKQVAVKFGWDAYNALQALALTSNHNEADWI